MSALSTSLLVVLAVVLALSMSSKSERTRALMLGFVVLLLASTPAMQGVRASLLSVMTGIGGSIG